MAAISYKFRSAVAFYALDLAGRRSVSVGDLRRRILDKHRLRDCRLVLFDAGSGLVFDEEEYEIPQGSSVIVKRLPENVDSAVGDVKLGSGVAPLPQKKANVANFGLDISCAIKGLLPKSDDVCKGDLSACKKDRVIQRSFRTMADKNLRTESRCTLCNKTYKEAVMIPCCQHSFCEKCITSALTEMKKCPKCSSTKCSVKDLLPNLSLRQAIVHFRRAQLAFNGLENPMAKYVPDEESGIPADGVSYAVPICQQEPLLPHSPSATGEGSNQPVIEPVYQSREATGPHMVPQNEDGNGALLLPNKYSKGEQTCFNCGLTDHLIGNCPAASNQFPVFQEGDASFSGAIASYGQPYWNVASFPHLMPSCNMYGNPGVVPLDSSVFPVARFADPSYMPSIYAGMTSPYGYMSMGYMPQPVVLGVECPFGQAENMGIQDGEQKQESGFVRMVPGGERPLRQAEIVDVQDGEQKLEREVGHNENPKGHHHHTDSRRSHQKKRKIENEASRRYSDEDSNRLHRKESHEIGYRKSPSQRDQRWHYFDRPCSKLKGIPKHSDDRSVERKRLYHSSQVEKQRQGQSGSDCYWRSHHYSRREMSSDMESHRYKHRNNSNPVCELHSSTDRGLVCKERDFRHISKYHRHKDNDLQEVDRRERVDRLDQRKYHSHKHR